MVTIIEQLEQANNAIKGLGFAIETLDVTEFVGLWNIKNKSPLADNMIYGKQVINGRRIAIEVYFVIDSSEIEVVLQTDNKNYSNDFERMPDVVAMIHYIYAWLQAEKRI